MKTKITVLAVLVAAAPHTRATISRAFRPDDFEVVWTANLSEAMEASTRNRPGLLLLDFNRPMHRGWGMYERLRTANPGAPVVVLSEHESIYDEAITKHKGAVLQKPVATAKLAEAVNSLLQVPSSGTAPERDAAAGPGDQAAESERFRAMLMERYTTSYTPAIPYHRWGLNE